jgi:hypothetical protein
MAIDRRTFLRGAGGAALALPFLDVMRSRAGVAELPNRLVLFCTGNGTWPPSWTPTGTDEAGFALGPILAPLAPHQSDLLVLSGIHNEAARSRPEVRPHPSAAASLLSGTAILPDASGAPDSWSLGGGISVDQYLAAEIGAATPFASLELIVTPAGKPAGITNRFSYSGPSATVTPEANPYAAFQRLFGDGGPADDPATLRARAIKASVLDRVGKDYEALAPQLGAEDRARVERHATAIREIEQRLQTTGGCSPAVLEAGVDLGDPAQMDAAGALHLDVLVAALACDLTRVVTLTWGGESDAAGTLPWLGFPENHHALSHGGKQKSAEITSIGEYYAGRLKYLIEALKAVPEGDGTLFDRTVILWCSGLGHGGNHTYDDLPWVLAGSAGGYFRTGRWIQAGGASHNDVLVSLCNAMGVATSSFGDPAVCNGPLPNLT